MYKIIHDAHCTAWKNNNRIFALIVIISSFLFALALSFTLKEYVKPLSHIGSSESGIVGWVSVNNYNKSLEIVYYVCALVFIPLITLSSYALWILFSMAGTALTRMPIERVLKRDAFTYLAFFLVLSGYITHLSPRSIIFVPLALFIMAKFVLLLCMLIRLRCGEETNVAHVLFAENAIYHGVPAISGVCLAIFILITTGFNITAGRQCWEIVLASALGIWSFWIVYSVLLSRLTGRSLEKVLRSDSVTYFPLVLLLLQIMLFDTEHAGTILLIIVIIAIISLKIFSVYANTRLSVGRLPAIILNSILIPCLIYAILYDSNINYSGAISSIDLYHEGEQVGPVSGLLRGEIPYRDMYLQHGLFKNAYVPLLAMKLFGETIESNRLMEHIINPLGFVCLYFLALQLFRTRTTAFLSILLLSSVGALGLPEYVPATGRHMFGFLALMLIIMGIEREKRRRAYFLTAGVCTIFALLYSLETGLYILLASGLFLIIYCLLAKPVFLEPYKRRVISSFMPLIIYTAGLIIGFLPFAIYFGVLGALDDMFQTWWRQCIYQIPVWGTPFQPLSHDLTSITSFSALRGFILSETFIWYFPVLIFLICSIYLIFRAITYRWIYNDWKLLLILITGIVIFRTVLGRSDRGHLQYSSSGYWLVCVFLLERTALTLKSWRGNRITMTLLIIGGFFWYIFSIYMPIDVVEKRLVRLTEYGSVPEGYVPVNIKRAGNIQAPPNEVSEIEGVVNYLWRNTDINDPIFDFSNQGGYYFLAERSNPTRYYQMIYVADRVMQEEVITDLERSKPKYVIFTSGSWKQAGFRSDHVDKVSNVDRYPLVAEYISSHYKHDNQIGEVVILKLSE